MTGDELLDAQVDRAIMAETVGAADAEECRAVAVRIGGVDLERWFDEWWAAATAALAEGEQLLADGHREAARRAFLRASTSFRTAGVMLYAAPLDRRLVESNRAQTEAFRRGAALLPGPPEIVEIPCEDTTLPGYWFDPDPSDEPAAPGPVVVLTGGYDGTAEEIYSFTGAAALERGYRVLCFDGPGQGAALLQRGMVLRPDRENVVGPILDWVIDQPGADASRIALVGLSLGAHLTPRAASAEHRLAACAADCGSFDLCGSAVERYPARSSPVSIPRTACADGCSARCSTSSPRSRPPAGRSGEHSWCMAPPHRSTTSTASGRTRSRAALRTSRAPCSSTTPRTTTSLDGATTRSGADRPARARHVDESGGRRRPLRGWQPSGVPRPALRLARPAPASEPPRAGSRRLNRDPI